LKFLIMNRGVIIPIRARNSTIVGSSNVMPIASTSRKYIEKAGGDKERARIGYFALGTALEDSKQYVQAAEAYANAVTRSSNDNDRGRAMHGEARSYVRASQVPKAIEVYTAITRLPAAEQPLQDAAKAKLGELQGGGATASAPAAPAATPATP